MIGGCKARKEEESAAVETVEKSKKVKSQVSVVSNLVAAGSDSAVSEKEGSKAGKADKADKVEAAAVSSPVISLYKPDSGVSSSIREGICVGKLTCVCPDNPMVNQICGGGIVIKPKNDYPVTNYHIIAEKIGLKGLRRVGSLKSARKSCKSSYRGNKKDWQLPSCGISNNWNPKELDDIYNDRDSDFCELNYVIRALFQSSSPISYPSGIRVRLSLRKYWSNSSVGNLNGEPANWGMSSGDQYSAHIRSESLIYHCVRHENGD